MNAMTNFAACAQILFRADRLPPPDADGFFSHPDLEAFCTDYDGITLRDPGDEGIISKQLLAAVGFDCETVELGDDVPSDHPAYLRYFETGGCGINEWTPTPPEGEGWRHVGSWDTEDGPVAVFVRPRAAAPATTEESSAVAPPSPPEVSAGDRNIRHAVDTPRSGAVPAAEAERYATIDAPQRIYLGTGCDEPECGGACYFGGDTEVTWCIDPQGPYDVEYIRADLPAGISIQDARDIAVGRKWRQDSRLETWFPLSAEQLERLKHENTPAPRSGDAVAPTYFSYGDDMGGFEEHATAAEARAAAEECLGYFRDDAPEGWNDGVRNVCWGVILGEIVETESRPSTPEDPCHPDCSQFVEYELRDCAAPQVERIDLREALLRAESLIDSLALACLDRVDSINDPRRKAVTAALNAAAAPVSAPAPSFQRRVQPWMMECFDMETCRNRTERNHRFVEEALELAQANGCTQSEAHQLVDYVFNRPAGELQQEVGGVMVTLAALCLACDIDMHEAGETELARIWTKIDAIRAKQATKPPHSPLPGYSAPADARDAEQDELDREIGRKWRANSSLEEWFPLAAEQLARDAEDARRYRWLRMATVADEQHIHCEAHGLRVLLCETKLDAAIDRAMGAEGGDR